MIFQEAGTAQTANPTQAINLLKWYRLFKLSAQAFQVHTSSYGSLVEFRNVFE